MTRLRSSFFALLIFVSLAVSLPASAATPAQEPSFPAQGVVASNANLRAGPGATYARVGGVKAGDDVTVAGCNDGCTWYKLDSGSWISASLVDLSSDASSPATATALPSRGAGVAVATPTAAPAAPATPVPTNTPSVQLVVVANRSTAEVLEIRNTGSVALDISGWRLDGSKGDDFCIVSAGTSLAPGAGYQVATGDSQPQGVGLKCGDKPIWNNGGETIYLRGPGGVILSIESVKR